MGLIKALLILASLLFTIVCIQHVQLEQVKLNERVSDEVLWVSGEVTLLPFNEAFRSPLTLYGKAPGNWFQNGTLGILVLDENNNDLGVITARAKGEWVGKDEVSFVAEGEFKQPDTCEGTLVFQNNNPTGHPISTVEVRLGIFFCEDEP